MNVEQSFPVEARAEKSIPALSSWIKKRRWFVIVVILPTILAAFYYSLIASDIYISESRFVITSPEEKRPQLSTLANLIQTTGLSGGQEQAREVLEYVKSRDALRSLEQAGIKAKFGSEEADFISRYPQPFVQGTFEDLFKYYGKMVKARLDNESGTAILEVQAFTARDAYEINRDLLSLSESLVNRLNERARTTGIAEAQKQVNAALERAQKARSKLAEYRNSQALIDPSKQAVGVLEIADKMIAERAALQAQLELMQRMTPDNPSIPALRSRISAISVQIASQDNRVVGSREGIASKVGGYENLLVEQEFATESLNVANAALVQARAAALRQQFYLERIVEPNMPDMPLLPRRLLDIIIVGAIATCLYFIGWMFIVGILEHAPED